MLFTDTGRDGIETVRDDESNPFHLPPVTEVIEVVNTCVSPKQHVA